MHKQTINTLKLEKNICDTLKEWQIKLGYQKETISLYYPLETLADLLEVPEKDPEKMLHLLTLFKNEVFPKLGAVQISQKDSRFSFVISPEGAEYIHTVYEISPFLTEFIHQISTPFCTLENIHAVFQKYSPDYFMEKSKEADLGYVFYFKDSTIDPYVYCINIDDFGSTYHRFTMEDYQKLIHD